MARQPEEKRKASLNIRRLLPCFAAAFISYWLFELYMNRLSARLFTSAALTKPEIIGAAAQFIGIFVLLFYLLYAGICLEKKRWFRLWTLIVPLITIALMFPQLHGQILLHDDGHLLVTDAFGEVKSSYAIENVRRIRLNVSGRSYTSKGGKTPGSISMRLYCKADGPQEIFLFSVDSFTGNDASQRLSHMLSIRRMAAQSTVIVEKYTDDDLQEAFEDEGLAPGDWAAVSYLLAQ
ncbi:MAG: hypothetical protein IKU34_06285 [Clostridia bacterium]|nr:hypothetical protein [Clostridia bacterium]